MEPISILRYSVPVMLAALGETVTQTSGVLQIGLEGIMLSSAYAAAVVTAQSGNPVLGLLCGALLGVTLALASAWFCLVRRADQVVVGTALNLLAMGATGALYKVQFSSSQLTSFAKLGGTMDFTVLIGTLLLVPTLSVALQRTGWGLATRAAGHAPFAVAAEGFAVLRLCTFAMAVGGLLAGLAGGYLAVGIAGTFAEQMTAGRGFVALAIVTFGRWNPWGVSLAALLMGFLETIPFKAQASGLKVPYQLLLTLPYLVCLVVLIIAGRGTRVPANLGKPPE